MGGVDHSFTGSVRGFVSQVILNVIPDLIGYLSRVNKTVIIGRVRRTDNISLIKKEAAEVLGSCVASPRMTDEKEVAGIFGSKLSFCPKMTMIICFVLSLGVAGEAMAACNNTSADVAGTDENNNHCGSCGTNCEWVIESGTLKVKAANDATDVAMGNYRALTNIPNSKSPSNATTSASYGQYHSEINKIEIGEGIISTGERAFMGLSSVETVDIPKSLTTISRLSFDRMTDMSTVNIPSGSKLKDLGGAAFQYSSSLSNESAQKILDTIVANGTTKIGDTTTDPNNYSQFNHSGITEIRIPDGVVSIGDYVFQSNQLSKLSLPEGLESIGMNAFFDNRLSELTLPEGFKNVGNYAFQKNQLTELILPDGLESIGTSAFWGSRLTSVDIPDSVISIGNFAFKGNQLTSVEIPDGVINIGAFAFELQGYMDENGNWVATLKDVKLGDSLETVGASAFDFNQIESLIIPASVNLGDYAIGLSDFNAKIICKGDTEACAALLNNTYGVQKFWYLPDDDNDGLPSGDSSSGIFTNINIAAGEQCNSAVYYYSGESCLKRSEGINCAGGYAEYKDKCWSELPFAKKHWTPAEANEWLNEDNNTVTLTFKKQ